MELPNRPPAYSVLDSGEIVFRVRRGDAEIDYTADLLILRLVVERCVSTHNLQTKDGRYQMTPEFLIDLAGQFAQSGIIGCTPTEAKRIWTAVVEATDQLKNDSSEMPS